MYFRPLPILTFLAAPILAALLALGVWQVERAQEKAALIDSFALRAQAPPLALASLCSEGPLPGEVITPPEVQGTVLRMFGQDASGASGWRLIQTTQVCSQTFLAEAGFEALRIGGPGGELPPGLRAGPVIDRFVVEPWPERPAFSPDNAPSANEWYWFDPAAVGRAMGADALNTDVILTPYRGPPAFLARTPPATHIGYAVTWFGMAVAFVLIYAVFHARAGRLRLGKARS
jgi:surfeit locus 1 family protein